MGEIVKNKLTYVRFFLGCGWITFSDPIKSRITKGVWRQLCSKMNIANGNLRVCGSEDRCISYWILKTKPWSILISLRNLKSGQDLVFRHPLKNEISGSSHQNSIKMSGEWRHISIWFMRNQFQKLIYRNSKFWFWRYVLNDGFWKPSTRKHFALI